MFSPPLLALATLVLASIGEIIHLRRCRRVAFLAFGPRGRPRAWSRSAPALRSAALTAAAWGLAQLWVLTPREDLPGTPVKEVYRHLVIALDVSPSMALKDAEPEHVQTRSQRASAVVASILDRTDLSRLRVSVVAFYTGAKPVIIDTFDPAVVKNILDDLPLELAFNPGKTSLLDGVRESAALTRNWLPGSTTLLIVSDGDTVPDKGLTRLPPAVQDVVVLGMGSQGAGVNIDGHLSRQDSATLRQLAIRLNGNYFDANERHIPTRELNAFAGSLPRRQDNVAGLREWALAALTAGSAILALLPLALARMGADWKPLSRASVVRTTVPSPPASAAAV